LKSLVTVSDRGHAGLPVISLNELLPSTYVIKVVGLTPYSG
jgi:hypothetical protein